jgi:peptide/nickel transport system permease protein
MYLGIGILATIALLSVLAPAIVGVQPDALVAAPLSPPSADHPFGTDSFGRDVFVRTFVAARVDYAVAAAGATVSMLVGGTIGILAGMARRPIWGRLLGRVTDALIAVPFALFILLIVVAVGPGRDVLGLPKGLPAVLIAVFLIGWSIYARLARAETSSLRQRDFVTAARLMGFSRRRIVALHIMPSVMLTLGTYAVTQAVAIVGALAALPFLGAGVLPPTPEWGSMMHEGRGLLQSAWWVVVFPGAALVLTAIALSLVADALLDRLGSLRGEDR